MNSVENKLEELIDNKYYAYLDSCDDKCVDADEFASFAKDSIEGEYGEYEFDDFNIAAYAKAYVEEKDEASFIDLMGSLKDLLDENERLRNGGY